MQSARLCALACSALALFLALSAPVAVAGRREARSTQNKFIVEVTPAFRTSNLVQQDGAAGRPGTPIVHKPLECGGIFTGFVVESHANGVGALRGIDGVINAWPARALPLPATMGHPAAKGAPKGARNAKASVHRRTGVDKLHAAGIRGKGVKVAIIDSGVDYTHKALGGCFGRNCRVIGGHDLVSGRWGPQSKHGGKPMDHDGHGTHVAGIVGGNGNGFVGVAPEAQLLAYKVFPDNGRRTTTEDILIQSFCDAYIAGADIITSSIGMEDGFSDSPWSLVASRIVSRGVVVTISAGNNGHKGPFSSGNGCNGRGVLSVAAINITEDAKNKHVRLSPAHFTSWGPTHELLIKPDIGAPGVHITSTTLNQRFKPLSGTSMAAPYIAGVAALYIGQHGGREIHGPDFARGLAKRIIASGQSVSWSAQTALEHATAPPFQVGTGLVDAQKVLHYTTELLFEPIALLDTKLFRPNWGVYIANMGNAKVKYRFEVEPQSAVEIYDGRYGIRNLSGISPSDLRPMVALPEPQVVSARQTKTVVFKFSQPKGANNAMLPLYGGKIWIKGDNGEKLCIPYAGAAYDTGEAFDTMFGDVDLILRENSTRTNAKDFIDLRAVLVYACTNLRWDIFASNWAERDWEYPPKVSKNGYVGSVAAIPVWGHLQEDDPAINSKSKTTSFPITRAPRGTVSYRWFGKLSNGKQIAPGNYTMRFAALRPYGNPRLSDHWDVLSTGARSVEIRHDPRMGAKQTIVQGRR
ncbi:hypothetical protein G6O67_001242 [Ophiocordyceps sinensis]|uniref:Peptidase S8/S53 domain-containing protein n=1 Tax=Ophiocordyceps sinensis TaxID=72228 RepID=A0A8H4V8Q2_9HYPO|nr:hypothetical protein G6O67_001242 [Ophiocordyceps sinensis]